MTPRKLLVLAAIAVLAVAAAVAARLSEPTPGPRQAQGPDRLFPDLEDRANQVTAVTVTHSGGTYTFRRNDGTWTLAQADGYPARVGAVREAVVALARLAPVTAKTDDPGRFAALNLRDPETDGAKSKRITLLDDAGQELAGLVVGKRGGNLGGTASGAYVRKTGAEQTWLVRGAPELPTRKQDWLKRTVVNLKEKSIQRTTLDRPEGETITVTRGDDGFTLEGTVPEEKTVDDRAVKRLATALSGLRLKDVRKADKVDFSGSETTTLTTRTGDGLEVTVEHLRQDEAGWVRVAAVEAPDDAQDRAETIRERTAGWVYQPPAYKARAFTLGRDQLFRDKNEKPAGKPGGLPRGGGNKRKLMEQLQKMRGNGAGR